MATPETARPAADPTNEPRDDQTGRFRAPHPRPLSPHLQVWRWHVTMAASILHRMSGIGLYIGAILVTAWLLSLAAGPEAYERFAAFGGSWLGLLLWFAFSAAGFYHLASGLRHLVWDTGRSLDVPSANAWAWGTIVFAAVATVAFWALLFAQGRISL
ncbi:succinate dehydrogenase, cytochrome b556 subunit [Brevundimonas sp. 2R-24]|uniref:Succinate dehydrogenase cytochrome b556 subunit n=1 Tax=Peiella sedimenti TaxID=3061083 RepID=A0ABT8SKN7_9CAUL|nr:succinate dehydrogenase, cytochrome b556 subunit [Caulobacteraceae bacterium XZ-24]